MSDKRWKQTERRVAKALGGRRVPVTGRQRGDVPDIDHEILSLEIKDRESLPGWIVQALDQANAASRQGRLPTVVIHGKGMQIDNCIVLMPLWALRELITLDSGPLICLEGAKGVAA